MITTNNRRLVAFGCSVTHGCELISGAYHPDNTIDSFPNVLSRQLGIPCENRAIPGASNDFIFHDIMQTDLSNSIVLICWTSLIRECWHDQGRYWFFIPSWAACFKNLMHDTVELHPNNKHVMSDQIDMLEVTDSYYDFFLRHKTDLAEYRKKLQNYHRACQALFDNTKIPLIELSCIDHYLKDTQSIDGEWTIQGRHPDRAEHLAIANCLRQTYFE